jgi:hypothetical protein
MQTGNSVNSDRTAQELVQKKPAAQPSAANAGELEWMLCLAATLQALRRAPSDISAYPPQLISGKGSNSAQGSQITGGTA